MKQDDREGVLGNVLITGAGQGVGRAMALALATRGMVVFVNDVKSERADAVVTEIVSRGGKAHAVYANVAEAKAVNKMVHDIVLEFDCIDILINNARAEPPRPDALSPEKWWDCVLDVNLKGAYLCSLACFDKMQERGFGRIINISSIQAYAGKAEDDWIAYSAAKSGLQGLTRSFAKKGMTAGITANIIAPDYIETEVMAMRWGKEKMAQYANSVPIVRAGTPEDVVKAVCFLIDSSFITGETIFVNGGRFVLS